MIQLLWIRKKQDGLYYGYTDPTLPRFNDRVGFIPTTLNYIK